MFKEQNNKSAQNEIRIRALLLSLCSESPEPIFDISLLQALDCLSRSQKDREDRSNVFFFILRHLAR